MKIAEMLGHFGLPLLTRHIQWRRPLTSSRDLPWTKLVESHSLGWVPDLLPNFGHEIGQKKIPIGFPPEITLLTKAHDW